MKNKVYKKSFFQRQQKALDNFGVSYQFRVGKREKFISVCGGAGFLFYIIVILAYVLKSLSQYLAFEDYDIKFLQKNNKEYDIPINSTSFFYAINIMYRNSSVSQNYESYLNSSFTDVFYLDSIYIEREDNNSYDYNIPIQPCLQSDWDKFQDKNEDRIIINNKSFYPTCFNLTGLNKLNRTFFEESQGNTVSIKLKINFNATYYKQNKEKVTNIINEMLFKVELYTFNKLIDYDSNIIYKKIEKSFYSYIDLKFTQFFDVYFQEFFFYKDYNLLLKNPIESEGVKYSWVDHGLAPANQRLE